jgi:ATP-binding cassette subfamily B protein
MILRFLTYYIPHKRLFWLDFCCAVLAALLELGFPMSVQWMVDSLLPTKKLDLNCLDRVCFAPNLLYKHGFTIYRKLLGA